MKSASGSIRKKTVTRNGKKYQYWEARYTTGYDPATGAQVQKSVTGKTQKEVKQKLTAATAAIDAGTYTEPSKMTLRQWLEIWQEDYLSDVKYLTAENYKSYIRNHIIPGLGGVRLCDLLPHTVQHFYKTMEGTLSVKTIRNIHGVLHKALETALDNGYIRSNPADKCKPPKPVRVEITPLSEDEVAAFWQELKGHKYENLFIAILFLGLREGEALGLTWDCVNLDTGVIRIDKQLISMRKGGEYRLAPTKSSRARTITASPTVIEALKREKLRKMELMLFLGAPWKKDGFVFVDGACEHLLHNNVYRSFKKIAAQIGRPDARVHDLRHSFAVLSLQAGDDIKTVQSNLGHATAAFTLNVYGHVTDQMKQASADRMEARINSIRENKGKTEKTG